MIKKLAFSFLIIFAVFTAGIIIFAQQRARLAKTEALTERLDAYADQVLAGYQDSIFPRELRITLLKRDGSVFFDNRMDAATMENHAARPEISEAINGGNGTHIRTSASNNQPYIYYAKDNGTNKIVRVALPYDVNIQSFLKPNNAFLYFVIALFLIGIGFIWYVGGYLERSKQRMQQLEIREKNRQLKHELTGNIAHELRTPVTSIRGFLEIVLDNNLEAPRAQEYLQRAYYQTLTLSDLISDMGLLSRLDEKRETFKLSEINISELLNRVQSDTKTEYKNIEIPSGLTVHGNENLLYSIFRNLTDNAVTHAGKDVEISVKFNESNTFTFADNGPGIPDEKHLERIFERFYRVNEGRTRDTGGSGLGLSIVKNAVQFHGGKIVAKNLAPHGLEFTISLP